MRLLLLVELILLLHTQSYSQKAHSVNRDTCLVIEYLLQQVSQKLNSSFEILDEYSTDIKLLRDFYKDSILNLATDSASQLKLANFVIDVRVGQPSFDFYCIEEFNVVSRKEFNQYFLDQRGHKKNTKRRGKGKKLFFPKVGITSIVFFNENLYCLLGIDYYSGVSSGSYIYFLFKKEFGKWVFCKRVFEMIK